MCADAFHSYLTAAFVVWNLWKRNNKQVDDKAELQDKHKTEVLVMSEKMLSLFPEIEKSILNSSINNKEAVLSAIRQAHDKTLSEVKETIKEYGK